MLTKIVYQSCFTLFMTSRLPAVFFFFQISSVAAQQKGMQANVKLAGAMGTATKTMVNMNKIMKPEDVAKNMRDFEQASAKLDMTDELSKCDSQL